MASSSVGGLSGAFIPVPEDAGMIRGRPSGCLTLTKLEAMTAVVQRGPGHDRHSRRHQRPRSFPASSPTKWPSAWSRPLGKKPGRIIGGLVKAHHGLPHEFIHRGGKPAPLQSLKTERWPTPSQPGRR